MISLKRTVIFSILVCCLMMTACNSQSVGVIGGADGPTQIYVSTPFGEQYEKKPIRMFKVDGELYYDSGIASNITPRCGTLDGKLKKGINEGEIPKKSGDANFEVEGYQNVTGITKEVNVDGEWIIFKKFDRGISYGKGTPKYCFYMKGRLNNAAADSEIVVLTDNENITFSDVYEPMLSSQHDAGKNKGTVCYSSITSGDKWGLSLYAEDVTPKGMTVKFEQFGGNPTGQLEMGCDYTLETTINDEWQPVKTKDGKPPVWAMLAYYIKENDITEKKVNWENLYGKLSPGFYRLGKKIMDFRAAGDYDEEMYYVYFTIE